MTALGRMATRLIIWTNISYTDQVWEVEHTEEFRAWYEGGLRVLFTFDPRRTACSSAATRALTTLPARAQRGRNHLLPSTHKFSELRAAARRDPERARRIDAAKARALDEHAAYRLAELRQALGVTQAELADLIGKSQSAVSQIETGDIGLSLDVLRSIVTQLGGSLEVAAVFRDRRVLLQLPGAQRVEP